MKEKFKIGDIVYMTKDSWLLQPIKAGDRFEVIDQKYGATTLKYEEDGNTVIFSVSDTLLMEFFDKVAEEVKDNFCVTEEMIDALIKHSKIESYTSFNRCTVVSCKLPNNFIITESSACVNEEDYDFALGRKICMDRIKKRLWEMETYHMMTCSMCVTCDDDCDTDCTNGHACSCANCANET